MALIVGATSSHGTAGGTGLPSSSQAIGHDLAGRRRQVVGDVVDGAGARMADRRQHGAGDVLDMDAREDLAGLVDAPRGAGLHLVDGAAAGAVDAGQAEDVDGEPASSPIACQARSAARRSMLRGWPGSGGVVSSTQPPPWSP